MVSFDGVHPGSLVASISGLTHIAQLEGPSLEGLHPMILFVSIVFGFTVGNCLCDLRWCQDLFVRDSQNVHHYWHLREQHSSWDWVRRDTQRLTCSFQIQENEVIRGRTLVNDMLSEFVVFEPWGVSGILFEFHYQFRSDIPSGSSKQHFHLLVLGQRYRVDHNVADDVIGKDAGFQADVPTF